MARPEKAPPMDPPPEPTEALAELEPTEALADDSADDGLEMETAVTDNVGEQSIEINVENLIAELEAETQHGKPADVLCARHKLEDYLERKRVARELADFEDFEVEDIEVQD
jgi:hypothetical protein